MTLLTIDNGQSRTKIGIIDESYALSSARTLTVHRELADILDRGHEETFVIYSRLLRKLIFDFVASAMLSTEVYIGGSFVPALIPRLDISKVRETFIPNHFIKGIYERIPIKIVDESHPGNIGAAYAFRQGYVTTAWIPLYRSSFHWKRHFFVGRDICRFSLPNVYKSKP